MTDKKKTEIEKTPEATKVEKLPDLEPQGDAKGGTGDIENGTHHVGDFSL